MFYVITPDGVIEEFQFIEGVIGFLEKDLGGYQPDYTIDDYLVIEGKEIKFMEISVKAKIVRKE